LATTFELSGKIVNILIFQKIYKLFYLIFEKSCIFLIIKSNPGNVAGMTSWLSFIQITPKDGIPHIQSWRYHGDYLSVFLEFSHDIEVAIESDS